MTTVERFMRLFRGYDLRHGRFKIERQEDSGKLSGRASTVDEPPTIDDFKAHLAGDTGIGVIPLTTDNRCYFAALDIDRYPVDHVEIAMALHQWPLFVTRSKSDGAHVWLFIKDGASAEVVTRFMKKLAGELGYGGCEIFPKQTRRASSADVGNWINLPFFGESRTLIAVTDPEKRKWVEIKDPEKFVEFVEKSSDFVTQQWLEDRAPHIRGQRSDKSSKEDFVDGPPCLERIKEVGLSEGSRNTAMFNFCVYLERKYSNQEEAENRAHVFNQTFADPLSAGEVKRCLASAYKKPVGFQCQQEPLKSYCDRATCLKRTHGVGSRSTDLSFEIGGFTKYLTEPPMYAFNADGKRVVVYDVDDLTNQKKFKNHIINAVSKVMPTMAQPKFEELLQSWLDQCEEVIPPPDTDPRTLIIDAFRQFFETYTHSNRDRILSAHAWLEEETGLLWFRMNDFKKYLKMNHIQFEDRGVVFFLRDKLGVVYHRKGSTVAGKSVFLYSVPQERVQLRPESETVTPRDVM